jgi:hypothetical protein
MMYNDRRHAQNASDHASLAAAWKWCQTNNETQALSAGEGVAADNGFNNDGTSNTVWIFRNGNDFTTTIQVSSDAAFGSMIGANTLEVSARAVAACEEVLGLGGFAIFAQADSCGPRELRLIGSNQEVVGDIHSNGELVLSGNTANPGNVWGQVTARGRIQVTGVDLWDDPYPTKATAGAPQEFIGGPPWPYPGGGFDIADYQPDKFWATVAANRGEYFDYYTDQSWTGAPPNGEPALYYVDGDVTLHSMNMSGVTIVATGKIQLVGDDQVLTAPYNYGQPFPSQVQDRALSLFSNTDPLASNKCNVDAITWSGSNHTWSGVQFAPNGAIDMQTASNVSVNGSIIGFNIKLAGSETSLLYQEEYEGEPEYLIELRE